MSIIQVTPSIDIDEREIQLEFSRASGPGGQNVNKVNTAVQLRFDVANSRTLPADVRARLISLAGGRITESGILIIDAQRFRTQGANRQDAIERLTKLVSKAAQKPLVRHKTRPTLASRSRRLETKHRRSETKHLRRPTPESADE